MSGDHGFGTALGETSDGYAPRHSDSAVPAAGRHRRAARLRAGGLVGLVVALAASGVLLLTSNARPRATAGEQTLAEAWPHAKQATLVGFVPDGPAYSPLYFLDTRTSVGTAPSRDGEYIRLLLRGRDGTLRELHRLPYRDSPQFGGFTLAGDTLAWAESTIGPEGSGATRMWAIDLGPGGAPHALTSDTGDVAFFNSDYDTVIADGRLHWVAVAPSQDPVTEARSVALTGGPVTRRDLAGGWAMTRWPWLVSAGAGQAGPTRLHNLVSGQEVTIGGPATELVTCSPSWCRALVLAGDGSPSRTDLVRPDGTDRRRIAGSTTTAALIDVAVLDRFEVLTRAGAEGPPTSSQELLLYDVKQRRTVLVATAVGMVLCRAGVLWWSTGDNEALAWHVLDLRTLR
ncbi:MAG TPA: hypothetical protein VGJ53_07425 [Micromonosporaceae bacterium]